MRYRYIIQIVCLLCSGVAEAQDSLKTHITYDMTAEAFAGTGDYNAYQLVTNRHHAVGTRSNTAYLRGAINIDHTLAKDLVLSGAIDAIASLFALSLTIKSTCNNVMPTSRISHSSSRQAAESGIWWYETTSFQ